MKLAMIDGKIVPLEKLAPAWTDRGTYFGDGVYEVVRSYNGRLFALEDHLERLRNSLTETKITGIKIDAVREKVLRAFEEAKIPDAKIYFHLTRGLQGRDHLPSEDLKPNFFLTVTKIHDSRIERRDGVKVCTHPDLRWKRCDIKSLNLLPNVLARMEAAEKGCAEAILVNEKGQITEGSSSAFFAVNADTKELVTRPLGAEILPSITRRHVIQIAPDAGLKVVEKPIAASEAPKSDELFIASTTKDIIPVVQFDGVKIAGGRPGPYTKALITQLQKHVRSEP